MLRDKMIAVMNEMSKQLAERDELINALAVALLSGKNLFILGEKGQAKSHAINTFMSRITGARSFMYSMTKGTDEEALFGRLDLASLIPGKLPKSILLADPHYAELNAKLEKYYELLTGAWQQLDDDDIKEKIASSTKMLNGVLEDMALCEQALYKLHGGKTCINTAGKIPDSDVVFLDELFKSSDGILNSLLLALLDRKYINEGICIDIPVISFFAASNEIPNFSEPAERLLEPLYDRFEIRIRTDNVNERQERLRILENKRNQLNNTSVAAFSIDELHAMRREVQRVTIPASIDGQVDDIICALRMKEDKKQQVNVSDRKLFGYHPLVQAVAWLDGRSTVDSEDLLFLQHYLWDFPDQIDIVCETVEQMAINPLSRQLAEYLEMAKEVYAQVTDGSMPPEYGARTLSVAGIKCRKVAVKKCMFLAAGSDICYTHFCLVKTGQKGWKNGRRQMDGYPQ